MATINPVPVITNPTPGVETVVWETLTEADTAAGYNPASTSLSVASLQIVGTWGGATIVLQGSNDNTNWVALEDTSGDAISFTADGGAEVSSAFKWVRPHATTAGTGRDVDVYLTVKQ